MSEPGELGVCWVWLGRLTADSCASIPARRIRRVVAKCAVGDVCFNPNLQTTHTPAALERVTSFIFNSLSLACYHQSRNPGAIRSWISFYDDSRRREVRGESLQELLWC